MLRTLVLDIETAPMVAYVWERRDVQIAINQLKADWSVMAWAAKWLGDPPSKTVYRDQRKAKDVRDDRDLLIPLWKLLNEADIVITQNGARFDGPRLTARFIMHGMKPPSPYRHLDTYKIAHRVAAFTSNSLDYLTGKLCTKYKKLSHGKFPGMELWKQCLAGNTKAWNEMRRYNINDVLATEELYRKLEAWAPESFPKPHSDTQGLLCHTCGSTTHREGIRATKSGRYYRLRCTQCGSWQKGEKVQ